MPAIFRVCANCRKGIAVMDRSQCAGVFGWSKCAGSGAKVVRGLARSHTLAPHSASPCRYCSSSMAMPAAAAMGQGMAPHADASACGSN